MKVFSGWRVRSKYCRLFSNGSTSPKKDSVPESSTSFPFRTHFENVEHLGGPGAMNGKLSRLSACCTEKRHVDGSSSVVVATSIFCRPTINGNSAMKPPVLTSSMKN